jgi:hypothetical protein
VASLQRLRGIPRPWRILLLALVAAGAAILLLALPPIRQGPRYYHFPDARTILGVPYFWNVVSNLGFAVVGALGLAALAARPAPLRAAFGALFAGVFLTAFGSAWYHLAPSAGRLLFDRLPMTVAFAAVFALVLGDRVAARFASPAWLAATIAAAAASALAWYATGDLRPYVFVQGTLLVLVPLLLLFFPGRGVDGSWLAAALALYLAAKLLERQDDEIYALGQILSGHTLKHVAAAAACWCLHRSAVASAGAAAYGVQHEPEAALHHHRR